MRTRPRTMRPVRQPRQPALGIAAQPGMHRLPGHPDRPADLGDRQTVLDTAITA